MKPTKFAFAAGSLIFALVTPAIARLAVATITVVLGLLLYWAQAEPTAVIGTVEQSRTSAAGGALMAISPAWPTASTEVVSLDPSLVSEVPPQPGDHVIVFGQVQAVNPNEHLRLSEILRGEQIGILPVGSYLQDTTTSDLKGRVATSNRWFVTALAIGMALFARICMRLSASAIFAGVTVLVSFLLLHLGARDGLLPVPDALFEPVMLGTAVAGAVLAFKASIGDRWRIGERFAAVVLTQLLAPALFDVGPVPEHLSLPLTVLAVLFPVLVPVSIASAMLTIALDLEPHLGWMTLGGLLVLRHLASLASGKGRSAAGSSSFHPEVNEHGEFKLDNLVPDGKGFDR